MVVIFNGKKDKKEKLEILKSDIEKLKANNIIPKLAIINVSKNPSSLIYIRNKINILKELNLLYEIFNLEENVNEETIIKLINKLNEDKNVNGILIQLPLPPHLDTYKIINSINPIKDVDGLTSYNLGKLMAKDETLAPCTPKAIIDILESSNIKVEGSDIVIVNNSIVVGKPLSIMLTNRFATVSICHIKTKDLKSYTKNADIVITATGVPKLIKKEYIKEGAIIIDAGISRVNGKVVGDVDFEEVSKICSFITPVPGGVGPVTIAMLVYNLIKCCKMQNEALDKNC